MREWLLGFVVGAVFAAWLPGVPARPVLVLMVIVALCFSLRANPVVRILLAVTVGASLSALQGSELVASRVADECVGRPLRVEGSIASMPVLGTLPDGSERQRFRFQADSIQPAECAGPTRLSLVRYGAGELRAGQRWRFDVKLKKPRGLANPQGFSSQSWYASQGIHARGHVVSRSRSLQLPAAPNWRYAHHSARRQIADAINALQLEGQVAAVLRALTVADSNGLSIELKRVLRYLGVSHLLVISGLHVGLVGGLGLLLGNLLARVAGTGSNMQAWLPVMLALAAATFYSMLASFTLPTQRALIMLSVFFVSRAAGLWRQGWNSLLFAAVIVLLFRPFAAVGSGFWLSFGAVAALLWYGSWRGGNSITDDSRPGRLATVSSLPARLLGVHIYMSLIMFPLGGWFFGGGSLVAALANMLMIPLVGFYIVPLALLGALGVLLGLDAAAYCWQLAALPLQWLLPLALSGIASDSVVFQHLLAEAPALLLALAGLALLLLPDKRRLLPIALLFLLPLFLPALRQASTSKQVLDVTVFDVGQGTAVLLQSGKRALLYDTGPGNPQGRNTGEDLLLPALAAARINKLDTLVVSHGDLDHSAGAQALLSRIAVQRLRHGADGYYLDGGYPCEAGESWRWPGGQRFRFLSPAVGEQKSSNNGSCVLQVDVGGYRMLLAGDIERGREREAVTYWRQQLASEWLLVAHHGSDTSSSYPILKYVQPGMAIVSAGYRNNFRHPHPDVVARLDQTGARVLNTALEGALHFTIAQGQVQTLRAYRRGPRPYWW